MAYNNWDKLSRAQRDNPKPKFAVGVADKALKKNPKNPFLLAWKADLSLQLNYEPKTVVFQLLQACQQPGLNDTRLLSYTYRLLLEANRRHNDDGLCITSVGNEGFKIWQNAAKALDRKSDRQDLWSMLAGAALREDCWEDFRLAVFNYNKTTKESDEEASVKKHTYYTQIVAIQLAAELQDISANDNGQKLQTQFDVARLMMKRAYEASPDDPIAVKDIRDLRFMCEIFARQHKCNELWELLAYPPTTLRVLMRTHKDDLISLKTRLLLQQQDWLLLEKHCSDSLKETLMDLNVAQGSKRLWELCAWRNDIWQGLLQAIRFNRSHSEGVDIVSKLLDDSFGAGLRALDRPLRKTYLSLRQFIGTAMFSDCKDYWEHHSSLATCFDDLRPFVQDFNIEQKKDIRDFMLTHTMAIAKEKRPGNDVFPVAMQNVIKFEYLFTTSLPQWPLYETVIGNTTQICKKWPDECSIDSLAIYALLNIHHLVMCLEEGKNPFGVTPNSRILLQAAMLSRHLVAQDKQKRNRPLILLAARLHLNLGLGKCAFQLYSHLKCKEMLLDTLSPYVLSRISLTHPFDVKGYQGFSADEELEKVISTIERMEKKTESYLYADMKSFAWDQAMDMLQLKRKLGSSLTKHICTTERRRIARLRGESTDKLPVLDYRAYHCVSDNVDRTIFLNCEHTLATGPLPYIMPNTIPNVGWMIDSYNIWDANSRFLYKEGPLVDCFDAKRANTAPGHRQDSKSNMTPAESAITMLWDGIRVVIDEMTSRKSHEAELPMLLKGLLEDIQAMRMAMEKLRMPGSTGLNPEDEPTLFHENMLISCYTKLEVVRALNKMIEHLREKVVNTKSSHHLKSKLPENWVSDVASETQTCYEAIRDVARSYIHLIKERGEVAIKAQVRWGTTGKYLSELLTNDDVNFYAGEYVDNALQAWKGVLEVKLK
ncbi:hypothetical protein EJ02DRAFT_399997 [Clathrospora elynae]|uniref:Uncharacterized protein n=1 Tax=Clathrospora elynae TaxID=706981 RepID=A0A6A5SUZ2_9PLEO|nr:hypothetical protein EJ02DRAFT_399997 [Clathrospora elynae]